MLTQFNIKNLVQGNFFSIPRDILKQKRLCLWQYNESKSTSKKLKVPYGVDIFNFVYRNLKDSYGWFDYHKAINLYEEDKEIYGLGIVLNNGPYVCIDIDNCIEINNNTIHASDEVCKIIQKFPKAYCEISPSQKGLHIIFKGNWECNREKSLQKAANNLTIEVYSGKSCRFITLTGNRIIYRRNKIQLSNKATASVGSYSFNSESVQFIYTNFFVDSKKNSKSEDLSDYIQNTLNNINLNKKSKNTYVILN